MSETVKTGAENGTPTEEVAKTFTQDELNAIVADRLAREKGKYADYESLKEKAQKLDEIEENNKTELQKALDKAAQYETELNAVKEANRLREMREKVSSESGVPVSLLNGATEEECKAQANAINAFAKTSPVAPTVKDSGETTTPTLTKADILAIKSDKARLKAIEENIELFQ